MTLDSSFNNSSCQSVLSVLSSVNIARCLPVLLPFHTTKTKLSRRNARQARVERLNIKRVKDNYDLRDKAAVEAATELLADD